MCTTPWDSNYDNLLAATNPSSLKERRTRACLCHLFTIVHGITDFADAPITHQVFTRSSGKLIFCTPRSRTLSYKHSFSPSTITTWNNLPRETANYNSLNSFKNFLLSMYSIYFFILTLSSLFIWITLILAVLFVIPCIQLQKLL